MEGERAPRGAVLTVRGPFPSAASGRLSAPGRRPTGPAPASDAGPAPPAGGGHTATVLPLSYVAWGAVAPGTVTSSSYMEGNT